MACTICTTDSTPTYCLRDYCIVKFFILKQWNGGNENHRHFTILGRIVFFQFSVKQGYSPNHLNLSLCADSLEIWGKPQDGLNVPHLRSDKKSFSKSNI